MKQLAYLLPALLCLFLISVADLGAQITLYNDSAEFDDDFGRLRDVDFEGLYSFSIDHVHLRAPGSLWTNAIKDEQGNDTEDLYLSVYQGVTIEFPTRTRKVELTGYGNPFYVEVTNYRDSVYWTALKSFPDIEISDTAGIANIRFWGTYGGTRTDTSDLDINWGSGIWTMAVLEGDGDTITATDFDELPGERFWFMGKPYDPYTGEGQDSLFMPVDINGVTFHEPYLGIGGYFMYPPEAKVDPDSPIGNMAIALTDSATMDFDKGVEGVLIAIDRIYEGDSIRFEILDWDGARDTLEISARDLEFDSTWVNGSASTIVGAASSDGIRRITLLEAMETYWIDERDTIIDGDTVTINVYETAQVEIYVSALHLAETPPKEIALIRDDVEELNRPGYLQSDRAEALATILEIAESFAADGNRSGAVEQLEIFRSELEAYLESEILAPEERRIFDREAVYVISRLRGPSSVNFSTPRGDDFRITRVMQSEKGMLVDYSGLATSQSGEILLVDMAGRTLLREHMRLNAGHAQAWWETGSIGGSGVYLLVLRTSEGMSVRKVEIR